MNGFETIRRIKNSSRIPLQPVVIMVTAYGREEIIRQAKDESLDGFLIKPVSQSLLFNSIMEAFHRGVVDEARQSADKFQGREIAAEIRGARILLAEDNEINQELAKELLEGIGVEIAIAENGVQALEMVQKSSFDAVLMDIQMPEMDGLEAAAEIRKMHRFKDLPIIAMTAHAMAGDKEKSHDAGMNDHITKPIDPDAFFSTLVKWIKPKQPVSGVRAAPADPGEAAFPFQLDGVDTEDGLRRASNNEHLYKKLLFKVRDNYADAPSRIKAWAAGGEQDEALRLAHSIKGSASSVGAVSLAEAAGRLETALGKEPLDKLEPLIQGLENAHDAFRTALAALGDGKEPANAPVDQEVDLGAFRAALDNLGPAVRSRAPKKCGEALASLEALACPPDVTAHMNELKQKISRYDFKRAAAILEIIQKKLA